MLVVEEDADIAKMLRLYFDSQGYAVLATDRCDEALRIFRARFFNVVLLAAQMPGVNDFLGNLRSNVHTKYISVIYLIPADGQNVEHPRSGFPDDYLTKPFAIEDLKQRVETASRRWSQKGLTHPVTGLPADPLIKERLTRIKEIGGVWVYLRFTLNDVADTNEVFYLVDIMWETVEAYRVHGDFIGQLLGPLNEFVIITSPDVATRIQQAVMQKFYSGPWLGDIPGLSCQWFYL
jgi:CheY-like chemotaxis protein